MSAWEPVSSQSVADCDSTAAFVIQDGHSCANSSAKFFLPSRRISIYAGLSRFFTRRVSASVVGSIRHLELLPVFRRCPLRTHRRKKERVLQYQDFISQDLALVHLRGYPQKLLLNFFLLWQIRFGNVYYFNCSAVMPMALASFSRVALRALCSPDSICERAAWVMSARFATSA